MVITNTLILGPANVVQPRRWNNHTSGQKLKSMIRQRNRKTKSLLRNMKLKNKVQLRNRKLKSSNRERMILNLSFGTIGLPATCP